MASRGGRGRGERGGGSGGGDGRGRGRGGGFRGDGGGGQGGRGGGRGGPSAIEVYSLVLLLPATPSFQTNRAAQSLPMAFLP